MIELGGGKTWFTSLELEKLALPGLPKNKRKINERAADENWALQVDDDGQPRARKASGRGGGLEYHISLLPDASRAELVRRGLAWVPANDEDAVTIARQAHGWAWYEMQSDKVKADAQARAKVLDMFEGLISTGMNRTAAATATHQAMKVSVATVYNYLELVKGVARADYLPALAPRRKGGGKEADVDDGAFQYLKSEYLRPERPTFSSCYFQTQKFYAGPRGIILPSEKTMLRKLQREVDPRVIVAMRQGMDAIRNMVPPQQRSVAHMYAMDMVNIDGHKFDVFVNFGKDAKGDDIIARPMMVAIQDIYSRMMLAWRIGDTESALLTRLAFADLFKNYGIPNRCLMDNGRAFASKWVTGGVRNRFRFTIREDDPRGLLPALGIGVQFAQPYSGQSKPIERSFRTLPDAFKNAPADERKRIMETWLREKLRPHLDKLDGDRRHDFGQDFARSGDGSVIIVNELGQDLVRRGKLVIELRNVPYETQRDVVFYLGDALPRFGHAAFDATGNGAYLAEVAAQKWGKRVSEVKLNAGWYGANSPAYVEAFADETIVVAGDDDILRDHQALQYVDGIIRVPENFRYKGGDGFDRHGDAGIAGILAWYASRQNAHEYGYQPVRVARASIYGEEADDLDDEEAPRGWWKPPLGSRLRQTLADALTGLRSVAKGSTTRWRGHGVKNALSGLLTPLKSIFVCQEQWA